jgi:hypothetical protein
VIAGPGNVVAQERHEPEGAAVDEQRVAVGWRLRCRFHGDDRGAIVDDELAPEVGGQPGRDETRRDIRKAAGLSRHQAHGLARIGFARRVARAQRHPVRQQDQRHETQLRHVFSSSKDSGYPVAGYLPLREGDPYMSG